MRNLTLGSKLITSGVIILVLIIMLIVASQVVGGLFKDTSTELVIEYNELDAIQELRFSISQLIFPLSSFSIYGNKSDQQYFNIMLHKAEEDLNLCENVLTQSHDLGVLTDCRVIIDNVNMIGGDIFKMQYKEDREQIAALLGEISVEIDEGINQIDLLLLETKNEIDEYIGINNTIIRHSTITILTIGIIVTLFIFIGGWLLIRSITKPISELVNTTKKISKGERNAKVNIQSSDEFQTLAESFNLMLDTLGETTVSKNYLNNILESMFDSLVVTNDQLKIQSVNRAVTLLLGYEEDELIDQPFEILIEDFASKKEKTDDLDTDQILMQKVEFINSLEYLVSKSGSKIPTLLSCAFLKNQNGEFDGLIIVAHDLTEKKAYEQKLERNRKQSLIDINEAQEEQRMRIATDLHDGLGQTLTSISYAVQDLKHKERSEVDTNNDKSVEKIQDQIDRAIRETKNLAHNLIPIVLKDFGLIVAIGNLINRANELYSVNFRFEAFDFTERIDPKREKVLYRICQESLNNIIKHSKASEAYYQIFWQDCSVVLVVDDNGVGFNLNSQGLSSTKSGIGLISMRERVTAFDGTFTINTAPDEGTEIIVEIPCNITTDGED